jgi:CBS domain containing-hemolysin-like protein
MTEGVMDLAFGDAALRLVAVLVLYSEPVALYTTRATELFMKACWPLIAGLNRITNSLLSGLGLKQFRAVRRYEYSDLR